MARQRKRPATPSKRAEAGSRARGRHDGRASTVIYVHGIGNKPIPSILKCQWDHALFGYDVGERSRLAYWVNREFYPDPEAASCASGDITSLEDEPTGRGISIRGHVEAVTLTEEVEAVATKNTDRDALLKIAQAVAAKSPDGTAATLAAADLTALVLPLPRVVREWITRRLVRAFLRDLNDFFYVGRPSKADAGEGAGASPCRQRSLRRDRAQPGLADRV